MAVDRSREPRLHGTHEASAMFESVYEAIEGSKIASETLAELQAERELLLAARGALARLLAATKSENFSRVTRSPMSQGLRAAIRIAEEALDA